MSRELFHETSEAKIQPRWLQSCRVSYVACSRLMPTSQDIIREQTRCTRVVYLSTPRFGIRFSYARRCFALYPSFPEHSTKFNIRESFAKTWCHRAIVFLQHHRRGFSTRRFFCDLLNILSTTPLHS